MTRSDVTFSSEGVSCAAWLYEPDGASPHPIIVMAHGFSATREQRLDAYAARFCEAGFGVLLFDYRYFGASGGEPRQLLDIRSQLADWRQAVAFARTVGWADVSRLALFGSSFSGGHAVTIAAEDAGVAAIIAQCPFQNGVATVKTLGAVNLARLTGHAIVDQVGALLGRRPHYIPAVAAPGGLAVMSTDDAKSGFELITPPDTRWENRVAARIGLHVGQYRPGAKAAKVSSPALWCIADRDSLCPADDTARWAAKAPRGEVKRYPVGHFDIYVGEQFEQVVADQIDFLSRHLLTSERSGHRRTGGVR